MKKIILIILIIFTSCKNSNNKNDLESDKEIEYVDLIGDFKRKDLTENPYKSWYIEKYDGYELDYETAKKISRQPPRLVQRKAGCKEQVLLPAALWMPQKNVQLFKGSEKGTG